MVRLEGEGIDVAVLICAEDVRGEEVGDAVGDVVAGDAGGDHLDLVA